MDTRTKEAVRYLGYGNHAVDGQTLELIRDSFEELDRVADKRIIYRIIISKAEASTCLLILIVRLYRILQSPGLTDDWKCTITQAHKLAQSTRFKQ